MPQTYCARCGALTHPNWPRCPVCQLPRAMRPITVAKVLHHLSMGMSVAIAAVTFSWIVAVLYAVIVAIYFEIRSMHESR